MENWNALRQKSDKYRCNYSLCCLKCIHHNISMDKRFSWFWKIYLKKKTTKKTYCLPVIFLFLLLCAHKYTLEKDMCVHLSSSFDFLSDLLCITYIEKIYKQIYVDLIYIIHILVLFYCIQYLIVFVLAI